jgi:hypothetical protein
VLLQNWAASNLRITASLLMLLAENRFYKMVKVWASPSAFAELGCPQSADHKIPPHVLAENRFYKMVKVWASPSAFAELGCLQSADHCIPPHVLAEKLSW